MKNVPRHFNSSSFWGTNTFLLCLFIDSHHNKNPRRNWLLPIPYGGESIYFSILSFTPRQTATISLRLSSAVHLYCHLRLRLCIPCRHSLPLTQGTCLQGLYFLFSCQHSTGSRTVLTCPVGHLLIPKSCLMCRTFQTVFRKSYELFRCYMLQLHLRQVAS